MGNVRRTILVIPHQIATIPISYYPPAIYAGVPSLDWQIPLVMSMYPTVRVGTNRSVELPAVKGQVSVIYWEFLVEIEVTQEKFHQKEGSEDDLGFWTL